jgi:hypothetical protein
MERGLAGVAFSPTRTKPPAFSLAGLAFGVELGGSFLHGDDG